MPSEPSRPQNSPKEQPSPSPEVQAATGTAPGKNKKSLLILGLGILLVGGLSLLLMTLFGAKDIATGPQMLAGSNPFIQACSVIDPQLVAKEMEVNPNMKQQLIESSYAFDPTNSQDKQLDLLQIVGQDSVESACKLRFDRTYQAGENGQRTATYFTVSMYVQQYKDAAAAKAAYNETKSRAETSGAPLSALPSHSNSFYRAPSIEKGFQPVVLHNNAIIYYVSMLGKDEKGEKITTRMDTINKDVVRRIDNKKGETIKSFSNVTQLGNNPFVDVCQSTDLKNVGTALGKGVEYSPTSFSTSQNYGGQEKEGASPELLMSACGFQFRTPDDFAEQLKVKPNADGEGLAFAEKYPHNILVQVLTTKSKEDASSIVTNFKKSSTDYKAVGGEAAPKVEDVKLGDIAIKINSKPTDKSPYDDFFYYIAKDSYAYVVAINFKRGTEPYKTSSMSIDDSQLNKILGELIAGTERAKKAVYKN